MLQGSFRSRQGEERCLLEFKSMDQGEGKPEKRVKAVGQRSVFLSKLAGLKIILQISLS